MSVQNRAFPGFLAVLAVVLAARSSLPPRILEGCKAYTSILQNGFVLPVILQGPRNNDLVARRYRRDSSDSVRNVRNKTRKLLDWLRSRSRWGEMVRAPARFWYVGMSRLISPEGLPSRSGTRYFAFLA